MGEFVVRPQGGEGRINCKNEFELCYMRHKYFRKTDRNPSEEEMKPYFDIARLSGSKTFFRHSNLFKLVGLEKADIIGIAQIHIVNFLGLFKIENFKDKYQKFFETFVKMEDREPTEEDVLDKNKAFFVLFLKQRMEDLVRICRQKAKNIKGMQVDEFNFYCGPSIPEDVQDLIKNCEKMGFKKLAPMVFRTARKRAMAGNKSLSFSLNDMWYIAVPMEINPLRLSDLSGAGLDPYDNIHNMQPDQLLIQKQEDVEVEAKIEEFKVFSVKEKVRVIRKFIKSKRQNPAYREEIGAARKMLKEMRA